jgi:hypothetical protein
VETGDDGQSRVVNDEHQRVGKTPQQGTADVFVYNRELPGIVAHALDHGVNRRAETSAQAGNLILVPALSR